VVKQLILASEAKFRERNARKFENWLHEVERFDLLIFHNFNYKPYWVEPYLPGVRDYIQSGGALAMIGGDLSFARTSMAKALCTTYCRWISPVFPPTGRARFPRTTSSRD
jgi:hypothetical protein